MTQFLIPAGYQIGMRLKLSPEEAHHVRNVFRLPRGSVIRLFDGEGHGYKGRIEEIGIKDVTVLLEERLPETASTGTVSLYQGILKGEKMDWLVQKAAELGVSELHPFVSARSVVKISSHDKAVRWQKIADAALKQCGRPLRMKVFSPLPFDQLVQKQIEPAVIFLWEGEKNTRLGAGLKPCQEGSHISLFVGPEGGFSEEEVAVAKRNQWPLAGLGPVILRSETATLVALTVIQYESENIG